MFAAIAPRYDLLNHLLSGAIDHHWRRVAARTLALPAGSRVLDVATGTGDLAVALRKAGHRPIGADLTFEMLAVGKRKPQVAGLPLACADALALPLGDSAIDGLTVAFGVRNYEDLAKGLREAARVIRPGGRIAILEFPPPPTSLFGKLLGAWLSVGVPMLGRLLSPSRTAYSYLRDSVRTFLPPEELARQLREAGFDDVRFELLTGGTVALHTGTRR